jgi:hypothetical protein
MGESEQKIPAKKSPAKTTNHRRMSNSEGLRIRGHSSRVRTEPRPSEGAGLELDKRGCRIPTAQWSDGTTRAPAGSGRNTSGAGAGRR